MPQAPGQPGQGNQVAACGNEEQRSGIADKLKVEAVENGDCEARGLVEWIGVGKQERRVTAKHIQEGDLEGNGKQLMDLPSSDGFDETMMSFYEEDAQIYMIATAMEKYAESRLQVASAAGNKELLDHEEEESRSMMSKESWREDDANDGYTELLMFSPQRENSYHIRSMFHNLTHTLLLDTGCSHSVIPVDMYNSLPDACKQGFNPRLNHGKLADGSGVTIHGVAKVKMKIGGREFLHDFQVAEINGRILLGMDFFRKHRCILDVHNYRIQLGGQIIECCDVDGNPLMIGVQLRGTTTIPASSKMQVEARLTRPLNRVTDGIVEPRHRIVGLLIAASLHSPRGLEICIEVMNTTDEEILIPSGTIIGQFVPVDEVETEAHSTSEYQAFRTCQTEFSTPDIPEHLTSFCKEWGKQLTEDEKSRLQLLLCKYSAVFSKNEYDLGRTDVVTHQIPLLPGTQPIKLNPYRHGHTQEKEIENQVEKLKQQGLIEEGNGAFSFPVVLVKKKDNKWRFCVDYRKLNSVTHKDAYPLPRVDDSLDTLGGSKWFSTLDMTSGYWQIPMDEEAKERSAFVTRSGLWQWKVLPFGLTSAPSTFERLMETVFRGLQWETLLVYLDDIIVFSKDVNTHLQRLETVFQRLQKAGLKLKPAKCTLFQTEVTYLGHVVSEAGIATDPAKVEAVRNWPTPKDKPDVRAFVGTCSYYRRFIPGFSELAKPLTILTSNKKTVNFVWTAECQRAFDKFKEILTQAPILAYPDFNLPYILDTDASGLGSGAVLSQKFKDFEKVIAYYSKTFNKEEQNYCVTRREMLAIVRALKHFRPYLYGQTVLVRTDHASLTWLFNVTEPKGQLARWLESMADYTITLEHRKGLKHGNADGLSRQCYADCKQCNKMKTDTFSDTNTGQVPAVVKCVLKTESATLPSKGSQDAAGLDLYSPTDVTIKASGQAVIDTGVQAEIPFGCHGRIASRSGLSINHGLDIGAGVVDPDYRGTIKVLMRNLSNTDYEVKKGDRIAQIICEQIIKAHAKEVTELKPTERGENGLGSSGNAGQVMIRVLETLATLAQQQMSDSDIAPAYKLLQKNTKLDDSTVDMSEESWLTRKLVRMMEHLSLRSDGVLIATIPIRNRRRSVAICPRILRSQVITEKHCAAHLGTNKTVDRIRLDWYWPGMTADIRRYVTACNKCQQSKIVKTRSAGEQYHLYAGRPWQLVAIDLCGPFPKTPRGNTQILVLTDHFTRWPDALPIPDGKAETVARVLDQHVFSYLGIPEEIHSDRGRQLESAVFKELCKLWGAEKTRSSPYRPQANSVVERLNRTLGASLRALLIGHTQDEWDLMLPQIMRSIRATPHTITGETPNYLMFGRETRLPDSITISENNMEEHLLSEYVLQLKERMEEAGDRLRGQQYVVRQEETEEPSLYMQGDYVWLRTH